MAFIGGNAGASTYDVPESFVAEFRSLEPHLDERQRRLVLAARAISLGHGGARQIARAVGVHPHTVAKGIAELASPDEPAGQLRQPGGGRKKITEIDPDVLPALLELAEPDTATRPNLQWTALSTRALAAKLQRRGHRISAWSVANLLRQHGFRLFPGSRPALRDGQVERLDQYRRVNDYVGRWLAAHQQVVTVSVGREYPSGPVAAVPDIGTDATMALAVNAIRTWCERQPALGGQLLVVADATVRATGRRPWRRAMTKL